MKRKTAAVAVLLAFFGFAFLSDAVTLTKEATEKVIIPKAYRITVEDSQDGSIDEMVVGHADIYPKSTPDTVAARLAIFVHEDVLYRSTGFGAVFEQVNCREETVTDPPEKGGQERQVTVCDNGGVIGENGGGSIVNPDGTEVNDVFTYSIRYDVAGNLNDLVFTFGKARDENFNDLAFASGKDSSAEGVRVLRLKEVLKVVEEPREWRPQ